jgi:uncharacterized protein YndB with AHSA1/START domain
MTQPVRLKIAMASAPVSRASARDATRFAVNAQKTIAASPAHIFAAWTDSRRRGRWLAGVKLTIHERTPPGLVRLTCDDDDTDIAVTITSKGRAHCLVAVRHTRLASAELVVERRHCWKEMLVHLKRYLESQG